MTDTAGYDYDRRDPRLARDHYMYASYRGAAFVEDYQRHRHDVLAQLHAQRGAGGARTAAADGADAPAPGQEPIDTIDILRRCSLRWRARGADPVVTAWVDVLGRKFEFAHRLRAAYGSDLRPSTDAETEVLAYALLGELIAATTPERDLRQLNALLKVNDLLSYVVRQGCPDDPEFVHAAITSLEGERRRVARYIEIADHGPSVTGGGRE